MSGMLTAEQMRQLEAAHGTEFDRLYLQGMIPHHEGALRMVAQLFATPGGGQQSDISGFANDIDAGQRAEIARMQALLHRSPGGNPEEVSVHVCPGIRRPLVPPLRRSSP